MQSRGATFEKPFDFDDHNEIKPWLVESVVSVVNFKNVELKDTTTCDPQSKGNSEITAWNMLLLFIFLCVHLGTYFQDEYKDSFESGCYCN